MRSLLLALAVTTLVAVDATPISPPQPRSLPGSGLVRSVPAYEVEHLVLTPGDPAGVAAWAEIAARGFHLLSVVPQGPTHVLYFERMLMPGSGEPHIPAAVAADASRTDLLRTSMRQILAERQNAMPRPMPAPAPVPVPENKP